jgi:hypothetical protein
MLSDRHCEDGERSEAGRSNPALKRGSGLLPLRFAQGRNDGSTDRPKLAVLFTLSGDTRQSNRQGDARPVASKAAEIARAA